MNRSANLYYSHIFSFLAINLIIGWGNQLYVIKLFCFILMGLLSIYTWIGSKRSSLPKPFLIIFLSIIISYSYHHLARGNVLSDTSITFVSSTVGPVIFGVLIYPCIKEVSTQIFVKYLKFFMGLSILFIFLQICGFWSINLILFSNSFVEMLASNQGAGFVGVSSSPFYMASQLAIITPVIVANSTRQKAKTFFYLVLSYASGQRAYFITILINIARKKAKIGTLLFTLLVLFSVAAFLMVVGAGGALFRGYDLDRLVLYMAGLNYIAHFPFGVGSLKYYSETVTTVSQNYPVFILYKDLIANYPPHNAFINMAIINGAWILVPISYFIYKVYKQKNNFSWGFLFAVAVSMFHNLSFLYADYFCWIILAFAFQYNKSQRQPNG